MFCQAQNSSFSLDSYIHIFLQEGQRELKLPIPKFMLSTGGVAGTEDAVAPMPGVVEKVAVSPGMEVQKGDPLVVMIAMKMEVWYYIVVHSVYNMIHCKQVLSWFSNFLWGDLIRKN